MLKWLPALAGKHVLEIGPGITRAPRWQVMRSGGQWTGVDPRMRQNPQLRCYRGEAVNLPFDDGSFDVVFQARPALWWFGKFDAVTRARVLGEIHRVLKPGGMFVATWPMHRLWFPEVARGDTRAVVGWFGWPQWLTVETDEWRKDYYPCQPDLGWLEEAKSHQKAVIHGSSQKTPSAWLFETAARKNYE